VSRPSTEQLLRELARDVPPVRRIPALRTAAAVVLAAWAIAVAALWALRSSPAPLLRDIPWDDGFYLAVLLGLAALAVGATLAALAGAVPGRERARGASSGAALLGITLAAGAAVAAVLVTGSRSIEELAGSAACIRHAAALAVLPALAAARFLARGAARSPVLCGVAAVTGAVGLGSVVVHASCRAGAALHVLVGHALAPALLGVLLAAPIALSVRWWRGRG